MGPLMTGRAFASFRRLRYRRYRSKSQPGATSPRIPADETRSHRTPTSTLDMRSGIDPLAMFLSQKAKFKYQQLIMFQHFLEPVKLPL